MGRLNKPRESTALHAALEYDETSPTGLRWKIDRWAGKNNNVKIVSAGDVAGSNTKNRSQLRCFGEFYITARVVWYLINGDIQEGYVIDHKDGDYTNNKIGNLKSVRGQINQQNCKIREDNTSGICGVAERLDSHGYLYWTACWKEDYKDKSKWFSINKYGEAAAKALAIRARENAIELLNKQNSEYSERHGK